MSKRHKGVLYSAKNHPYVPAKLVESKGNHGWYIEYWVWHVEKDKLVRKRFYNVAGSSLKEKRKNARDHCIRINASLAKGATLGKPAGKPEEGPLSTLAAYQRAEEIKRKEAEREGNPAHYMHRARIFHDWLTESGHARTPLEKFDRKAVYAFLDWLTDVREVSSRTKNNYLSYVRMASNVLIDRGILTSNPTKGIPFARTEGKRHVPFSPEDQDKLEKWMLQNDPDLFRFTRMIYYGFIRRIEILRLKISQVDMTNGIILVWSGNSKNKRQMPVVITPGMKSVLQEMLKDKPPPNWYLFGRHMQPGPNKWHPNRVSERHREALEACEIDTSVHDLYGWKHTGVCAAYRAGVDIYSIMRQCRHSNLNETENYMRSMGLRISSELKNTKW